MDKTNFTFEVYRIDNRTKDGLRLMRVFDLDLENMRIAKNIASDYEEKVKKTVVKVFETYVEKTNMLNGEKFMERYDTPYYCSPSSETYWSM